MWTAQKSKPKSFTCYWIEKSQTNFFLTKTKNIYQAEDVVVFEDEVSRPEFSHEVEVDRPAEGLQEFDDFNLVNVHRETGQVNHARGPEIKVEFNAENLVWLGNYVKLSK